MSKFSLPALSYAYEVNRRPPSSPFTSHTRPAPSGARPSRRRSDHEHPPHQAPPGACGVAWQHSPPHTLPARRTSPTSTPPSRRCTPLPSHPPSSSSPLPPQAPELASLSLDALNAGAASAPESVRPHFAKALCSKRSSLAQVRAAVRNHGGGHYNHALFWNCMAPGDALPPSSPHPSLNSFCSRKRKS
jgi:hypothetical protein